MLSSNRLSLVPLNFIHSFHFIRSDGFLAKCHYLKICFRSLTYNHHMSQDYASDVALEPIIWIVDNFSGFLGPVNNHTTATFYSIRTDVSFFISVFCGCSCCADIGCRCDCSFGWAIVLLGKEPSPNDISRDIRLLATYQCHIPLCDGGIHTARPSTRCKWLLNASFPNVREKEICCHLINWTNQPFVSSSHVLKMLFSLCFKNLIVTNWKW